VGQGRRHQCVPSADPPGQRARASPEPRATSPGSHARRAARRPTESFRGSWEAAGGSDIRIFRNVDKPNQVFTSMWWGTAEACRRWGTEHYEEVMKAAEGIVTSMEPEFLWEEI
jgi:heme-degrading monooxygenase HmoA